MATKKATKVVEVIAPTPPKESKWLWAVTIPITLATLMVSGVTYLLHPPLEHWHVTVVNNPMSSTSDYTFKFNDGKFKKVHFKESVYLPEGSVWDLDVRKMRLEGSEPNTYREYGAYEYAAAPPEEATVTFTGDFTIYQTLCGNNTDACDNLHTSK